MLCKGKLGVIPNIVGDSAEIFRLAVEYVDYALFHSYVLSKCVIQSDYILRQLPCLFIFDFFLAKMFTWHKMCVKMKKSCKGVRLWNIVELKLA